MSDTVLVALITGGSTALVGIAAIAFNFWNTSRERQARLNERSEDHREWYSRTLFEKRIKVVQEAYEWVVRLDAMARFAKLGNPNSANNQTLSQLCGAATEWYYKNAVLFYDTLPNPKESALLKLIGLAHLSAASDTKFAVPLQEEFLTEAEHEIRNRLEALLTAERGRKASESGR